MKTLLALPLCYAFAVSLAHAQEPKKCRILISGLQPSLQAALQVPERVENASCDEVLKRTPFAMESGLPIRWTNGVAMKWSDALLGQKTVAYEGNRTWLYTGKVATQTPEEFLFKGKHGGNQIDGMFHIRWKDGRVVHALYQYEGTQSGLIRYTED